MNNPAQGRQTDHREERVGCDLGAAGDVEGADRENAHGLTAADERIGVAVQRLAELS